METSNASSFWREQRSGAKNLALDFSAEKQQGDPALAGPQGGISMPRRGGIGKKHPGHQEEWMNRSRPANGQRQALEICVI